eukprot:14186417-Ditylum_brightwellii.AAC.1
MLHCGMMWGPWCWLGDWQGCTLGDDALVSSGGMMLGLFFCTLGGGVVSTVVGLFICTLGGGVVSTVFILSGIFTGGTVYGVYV